MAGVRRAEVVLAATALSVSSRAWCSVKRCSADPGSRSAVAGAGFLVNMVPRPRICDVALRAASQIRGDAGGLFQSAYIIPAVGRRPG
ncbi:hypothetical protein C8N35_103110 [Breoghania corrubedonensis]|uniref:Uncharacterized protein n=1 Tax=Breoghania corrubedonensis TaxID=665038 RepID=A0A2T5VB01_9HYPH|nr:hypothetical protein C8N35_103110 [Breoghania corrubedonensis]